MIVDDTTLIKNL